MADVINIVYLLVILLLIALLVIILSIRLTIPYTLGLVIVGFVISFIPALPSVRLDPALVIFVFLPALLFEGSWSISVKLLWKHWLTIFLLVGPGFVLSLVIIAIPLRYLGGLDWGSAFLLSAILAPTDPVAVIALFRQLKVNVDFQTIVEGESLFNDGVAGVFYQIFLVLAIATYQNPHPEAGFLAIQGGEIFLLEGLGGVLIGGICGFLVSRFVRYIDDPLIETTITIITAYGVSLLANAFHSSNILAVIVAILILANYGQRIGMARPTRETIETFWSVIAFLANALLFLLVGIELNPIKFINSPEGLTLLKTAGIAVIAVLASRFATVMLLPRVRIPFLSKAFFPWRIVLFWSGLRGALSLALALSLPIDLPQRDTLLSSTYLVVLFTLLVQGLTMRWMVKLLPAVPMK
jgi:CPA1 family monovalent cation:H+ antiporter